MVIIDQWNKPKNCYNCPFNKSDCVCGITKSTIDRDDYTTEDPCPIKEVPEIISMKRIFDVI